MRLPRILRFSMWAGGLLVLAGLLAGAYWLHGAMERERAGDKVERPKRDDNPGEITLKTREFDSYGEVEPAKGEDPWYEPVSAYGRVVANPLATVEVRSAFAGTLRQGNGAWPA